MIEAFQIVSIWRAADLVSGCVRSLNHNELISACTIARSLVELAVRYGEAANDLNATLKTFAWDKMRTHVLILDQKDAEGKRVGLESYIEKLMSGTRLEQVIEVDPHLEIKNIISSIERLDKKLTKNNAGYAVMPIYQILCEVTHPNVVGFERFLVGQELRQDDWLERRMQENAVSANSNQLIDRCLWALSFGAGSINGCFGVFQVLSVTLAKSWESHCHIKRRLQALIFGSRAFLTMRRSVVLSHRACALHMRSPYEEAFLKWGE